MSLDVVCMEGTSLLTSVVKQGVGGLFVYTCFIEASINVFMMSWNMSHEDSHLMEVIVGLWLVVVILDWWLLGT